MLIDFSTLTPSERYKILASTITPRPIAWIVSQSADGLLNAAPFSFFNAFAGDPPVIGVGISHRSNGQLKDTRANIGATGEFVVNLVSFAHAERMNITATEFDYGIDELSKAGLTTLPSSFVKPPRIAESPVAFECQLLQIVPLGEKSDLILGKVVAVHIIDEVMLDTTKLYIDKEFE